MLQFFLQNIIPAFAPFPRNCFSCDQRSTFLCSACHVGEARKHLICIKKTSHPQSKDKESSGEGKKGSDQPFFRLQLAFKCKQPAFYANDIRKNWHSGRLKSDGKYLNCRFHFSLRRERFKSFHPGTKMVKISIFMLGLKESCRKY